MARTQKGDARHTNIDDCTIFTSYIQQAHTTPRIAWCFFWKTGQRDRDSAETPGSTSQVTSSRSPELKNFSSSSKVFCSDLKDLHSSWQKRTVLDLVVPCRIFTSPPVSFSFSEPSWLQPKYDPRGSFAIFPTTWLPSFFSWLLDGFLDNSILSSIIRSINESHWG